MAVNDNWGSALRKSANQKDGVDANDYWLSVGSGFLAGVSYDFIDAQQTSGTVETYVYKTGGSSGTITATLVITYTDSNKTDLDTVERTV